MVVQIRKQKSKPKKETKIELRVDFIEKSIIAEAAVLEHKSASGFVLETAIARAKEVLAKQINFYLNEDDFKKFVEEINSPGKAVPEIVELMKKESPFGKEIHIK